MPEPPFSNSNLIPQVCVIPFRRVREVDGSYEFCLVTSLRKKRWIFPKGIVDPGETLEQSACKEVWEEAGLRGELRPDPIGSFDDQKWGCELSVQVVLMEVTEAFDQWPEFSQRQREWFTAEAALCRLKRNQLRLLFQRAVDLLESRRTSTD
jgi:8-oxo-dGTP pyrophosphatase MutT (NUDIX family)